MTITKVYTRQYRDTGLRAVYVEWSDGTRTEGTKGNVHMDALLKRAKREGIKISKEIWG